MIAHHMQVFADHDSSLDPIAVPRSWLWNLPRRTVYFGTSIPTIFRGIERKGVSISHMKENIFHANFCIYVQV